MKTEYSGWGGVRTLAKKLGYSWFDVCDILWKTKDKDKREQLLELINLYEPKVEVEKVEETVVPTIVKESAIKKPKEKTKELFVFKTAEPYRKDYSRLVYWCNPFEPINKGKLGTTQGWRKEERFKQYY